MRRSRRSRPSRHHLITVQALALALILVAGCSDTDPGSDASGGSAEVAGSPTSATETETETETTDDTSDAETGIGFAVAAAAWEDCDDGYQCAAIAVPLDHDRPGEATIDLAVVRVPAPDRDDSGVVGSILVNPGGPGGSGVDYVRSGFRLDSATMDDHHLVGFDPRGIGASNPLTCGSPDTDGPLPDYDPDDEAERSELDLQAKELADRCQRLDGDLLPHLSTESVVADLDLLRQALGDEKLSYLGLSYGTLIGLRYAERHPDRVGRLILDGVVDPATTLTGLLRQQAEGFDRVLAEADQACLARVSCPEGGLIATYDRVAERLDRDGPIDDIGSTELAIGTLLSLYAESLWPRYAEALADADQGRIDGIRSLYGLYAGAADEAAYNAVVCTDSPLPAGTSAWDDLAEDLASTSPRFGAVLANEVRACAHWPVRATNTPEPVSPDGLPPVLILSTLGDAATPVENAVTVAALLDEAAIVTVDDTSHTAYGRNFCVESIVADYIATGSVPDSIHRC